VLDGGSLDQLRSFIAAVDEAASRLLPADSGGHNRPVSELVSNLEDQIGVMLFDRSGRYQSLLPRAPYCSRTLEASWPGWTS